MTRKTKGKAHKNFQKRSPKSGQGQPVPHKNAYSRLKRGLLKFLSGVIEAIVGLLAAGSEWLGARWRDLTSRGQKAVLGGLWFAGVAFGVYCVWFARKYSMPAPVVKWGILRVEARWGVLLLLILVFLPLTALYEWVWRWPGKQTLPRLSTPDFVYRWRDRVIPPLAQARWLYARHHNTRALERTRVLLAQEPDNVAARELLALIETRLARQAQARQENAGLGDAPKTSPMSLSQRLLDSKLPSIMARVVAATVLCLCLYGLVYYARVGITQGWLVTVRTGHDKSGNSTSASALAAMLECFAGAAISLLYLVFEERVLANTAVWEKYTHGESKVSRPVEK